MVEAIKSEINSLIKDETWKLIERKNVPNSQRILNTRWIFKKKSEANNKIRYKARLVVCGFLDGNKYDLSQTYTLVARLTDIRFMLAVVNKFILQLQQFDVKTTFLNGDLKRKVYMEIPDGVEGKDKLRSKYLCEISKALYGLKVSPKCWYEIPKMLENYDFNTYEF